MGSPREEVVFSLNVTGSFADDIICVISSARYRPLWLISS